MPLSDRYVSGSGPIGRFRGLLIPPTAEHRHRPIRPIQKIDFLCLFVDVYTDFSMKIKLLSDEYQNC
jgi:hypothetical protein